MMTESAPDSRAWTISVVVACIALLCLSGILLFSWLAQPPTVEGATALAESGELIAYSKVDRRPRLLMIEGDQLVYDRLRLDWSPVARAGTPEWRFSDNQYRLQRTPTPANATLLICAGDSASECDRSIDLVGEVTSEAIAYVEVGVDGNWERHLVFGRGFVVPLDRRREIGDVRWLDADEVVVWSIDRDVDGKIVPRPPGQVSVSDLKSMQAR